MFYPHICDLNRCYYLFSLVLDEKQAEKVGTDKIDLYQSCEWQDGAERFLINTGTRCIPTNIPAVYLNAEQTKRLISAADNIKYGEE